MYLDTLKSKNGVLERKRAKEIIDGFGGSYAAAAKSIGVNRGTLYSFVNGKRPASKRMREALGMRRPRRVYDLSDKEARRIAVGLLGILWG